MSRVPMKVLFLVLAATVMSGCASEGVCMLSTSGGEPLNCIQYDNRLSETNAKTSCEGVGGIWESSCSQENLVGECQLLGSTSWYYEAYLSGINITVSELEESCEEISGEFTPFQGQ